MRESLGGYRTLTELAAELGYSRTYIRRQCRKHEIPIEERAGRSWVSPDGRRKLKKILPHRGEDQATSLTCKAG